MNFEAKQVTAETAMDVGSILITTWRAAYSGIMPDDYLEKLSAEKRTRRVKDSLAKGGEDFFLFYIDGKPTGTAILNQYRGDESTSADGEITAFYFLPDYWGRGCAKQAMDFCLRYLYGCGYTNIRLWVLEENRRARRFYEKCGFCADGARHEVTIGKPLTDLRYQKTIGDMQQECARL